MTWKREAFPFCLLALTLTDKFIPSADADEAPPVLALEPPSLGF